jgi:hypothetical protein
VTPNGGGSYNNHNASSSSADSTYYKAASNSGTNAAFSWAQQQQQQQHHPSGGGGSGNMGVGGSWASSSSSPQDYATPSITITSTTSSSSAAASNSAYHPTTTPSSAAAGGGGMMVSDGSYERALILELCPPGGMKAEPPPDKLAAFAKAVSSLNPDLVCPVLLDCLEEGQPWIIRAKALHVMDTCIHHYNKHRVGSGEDTTNPYANFFYACRGEIEPLAHHARSAIREPAKKVLESLGIAVVSETHSTAFASQPSSSSSQPAVATATPAAVPIPNLLDFDDDDVDDNVHSAPTAPVPPPVSAPPPAAATPTAPSTPSLFGGLKVQTPSTPSAALPPAPASGNLLGDLSSPPPAAAAAPSGGGLFGDVVVKQPKPEIASTLAPTATSTSSDMASLLGELTIPDQPNTSANNGSAFGFINQTAGPPSALSPTTSSSATAASVPLKQSFDPLLNPQAPSPTTARAMMQLSQEQMKAMAYQQMIMQQQLQMAMALQQQQHNPYLVGPGAGAGRPGMPAQQHSVGGGVKMMMGVNAAAAVANSPFSFLEHANHSGGSAKQDDKRFDFVKDAMKHESKK